MKHKLTHLFIGSFSLLSALLTTGCGGPTISEEDREKRRQEEIEQRREKLDLQVQDLVGNKRLKLKITNNGKEAVKLDNYILRIQVVDVRNSKGERRQGHLCLQGKDVFVENFGTILMQGTNIGMRGEGSLGIDGIVGVPYAMSDNHYSTLAPNVSDETNSLVIIAELDATKVAVKCILEPKNDHLLGAKRIEKTIHWELGNQIDPISKKNVEILIEEKIELSLVHDKITNNYTALVPVSIRNIGEYPINLKGASYSYTINRLTKSQNINEDLFLMKGGAYRVDLPIELGSKSLEEAKDFLEKNTFPMKFSVTTLDTKQVLIEKEQTVTFIK